MYKKLLIFKKSSNKFNFKKIRQFKVILIIKRLNWMKSISKDKTNLKLTLLQKKLSKSFFHQIKEIWTKLQNAKNY